MPPTQRKPTNLDEWAALARQFHGLQNAFGVRLDDAPDPIEFDEWLYNMTEEFDDDRYAGQFVLELWSSLHPWKSGPFRLRRAIESWHHGPYLAVFVQWARRPVAW